MPVANIHVLAGHPRPVLQALVREAARTYAEVLGAPIDRVQVWITEVDPQLAAIGGETADVVLQTADRREVEIPFVRLAMMERPLEQEQRAIRLMTDVVAAALGSDPARIRVEVQHIFPERWGIGGVPASILRAAEIAARQAGA